MKLLVSGLLNTETTAAVRGFPIPYYPIDYPFFGGIIYKRLIISFGNALRELAVFCRLRHRGVLAHYAYIHIVSEFGVYPIYNFF